MRKLLCIVPFVILFCFTIACQDKANKTDDVKEAVVSLYSALNSGKADSFIQYMAPGGYTEFSEDGGPPFNIDEEYVRRVFKGGLRADFEVQELKVRVLKDLAIATGYRVGRFIIPDKQSEKSKLRLSMVWFCQEGKWKLVHVHLSPSIQQGRT